MSLFGDLFRLKWMGIICPCLEKEDMASARRALQALDGSPVEWHRKKIQDGASAFGMVSGFLKGGGVERLKATLTLRDDADDGACIIIQPNDDSEGIPEQSQQNKKSKLAVQKKVPLKKLRQVVSEASTDRACILFMGISYNEEKGSQQKDQLLKVTLLDDRTGHPVEMAHREEILQHWRFLLDFLRSDDPDQYDLEATATMNRAQKATHFAKREIELQTKKRDREARKSKLMEKGAGLKYTALAMANRGEMS